MLAEVFLLKNYLKGGLPMKKLLALMLSLAMILTVSLAFAEGKTYTVGICNYVDDASLNQIVESQRHEPDCGQLYRRPG